MLTKYGLVSVLRISDTPTFEPPAPAEDPLAGEAVDFDELQAARVPVRHSAAPTATVRESRLARRDAAAGAAEPAMYSSMFRTFPPLRDPMV